MAGQIPDPQYNPESENASVRDPARDVHRVAESSTHRAGRIENKRTPSRMAVVILLNIFIFFIAWQMISKPKSTRSQAKNSLEIIQGSWCHTLTRRNAGAEIELLFTVRKTNEAAFFIDSDTFVVFGLETAKATNRLSIYAEQADETVPVHRFQTRIVAPDGLLRITANFSGTTNIARTRMSLESK